MHCDFNKVALKYTSAWVFPVNLMYIFRAPFYKNPYGGLLLTHLFWFYQKNYERKDLKGLYITF